MKTFTKKLLALLLVVLSVFAFAGCGDSYALKGDATVIIHGETDVVYEVDLDEAEFTTQNTVLDLLAYLCEQDDLAFSAGANGSAEWGYSAFINSIGDLVPGGNQYVAFFHNKQSDKDVSAYALPDRQYGDTTLYYSGLGVGSVKLVDDLVVYFCIESF
ncbi:MAG: hypothetical protein IJV77_01655 [Clostridia bacterium]|nr:hypothetical protein [Clostridia bacterium]